MRNIIIILLKVWTPLIHKFNNTCLYTSNWTLFISKKNAIKAGQEVEQTQEQELELMKVLVENQLLANPSWTKKDKNRKDIDISSFEWKKK